jgi:acetyl esterase/lipase
MTRTIAVVVLCVCPLLVVGCVSLASAPAGTSATSTPNLDVFSPKAPRAQWSNVAYVPEGSSNQRLDVYLPESGDGPFPTILAIHGGGFTAMDKLLYREIAGHFTGLGYAFLSANYRLAPAFSYPAQVEDVFCALAWAHANSTTYGIDDERIFVLGDSAGGYLAAMLGTIDTPSDYRGNCPHALPASDWIEGVVVFYGFYDFTSIDGYPKLDREQALQPYWGAEYDEIPVGTLAEMSPMSWVDGTEPPFLLIHGMSDDTVPSQMSEEFAAALEKAGVDVELLLLEADHAFILQPLSSPANSRSLEAIEAFLD